MVPIPIIVLSVVFLLIASRRVGGLKLRIWQTMTIGALSVLLLGQISLENAIKSVNTDVILFLAGMFVVGAALEESGYLSHLSHKAFRKAGTADSLLLYFVFGTGIASAFLLNDTLAIIATPVAIHLAKRHGIKAKSLLLALCFSVTIGSVMSPIGNPQNLLITINGNVSNPFITFFSHLLIPTLVNLFIAYLFIKHFYPSEFGKTIMNEKHEELHDERLAYLSKVSLSLIIILVAVKILSSLIGLLFDFKLTYIALVSMIPVLTSGRRLEIIKKADWRTIVFFVSMFILMESVWLTGFFQSMISSLSANIASVPMIFMVGVLLSQLISNVPLAALYLPLLIHAGAGTKELVTLATASTIGGNLFILGAASNVIIIQNAEKKGETISFWEFARVGIPLTVINVIVYYVFLSL